MRTGEIITEEEARRRRDALASAGFTGLDSIIKSLPASFVPTVRQMRTLRVRRNDPCPCGSGRKFKKCCMTAPKGGD